PRPPPARRDAGSSRPTRPVNTAPPRRDTENRGQVPRRTGAGAPENSVTEFSRLQERELAKAAQEAEKKGEAFPDVPVTLYEAIVRDYTGRTPEAREQTLIVTHLNEDRRVLHSMIQAALAKPGEQPVPVPVLP
ncbi:hypothetical protein, partial [Salmonella enterica]|uniref:hypothetical protein n=1 Tax=Salmonella enterica TaxID=28901 RepID=UPI003CC80318